MKKLIVMALAATIASCDIYKPSNGRLDGFWQLAAADTLATGSHADLRCRGIFWAVQANLLRTQTDSSRVLFRFTHIHDTLTLFDPYIDNRDSMDIAVTSPAILAPYGVNNLCEKFAIMQLGDEAMVLQSQVLRLYFRRY